jgi:hypothetical protein
LPRSNVVGESLNEAGREMSVKLVRISFSCNYSGTVEEVMWYHEPMNALASTNGCANDYDSFTCSFSPAASDEGTSKGGPTIFKHELDLVRWVEKEEFQKCRLGPRYEMG